MNIDWLWLLVGVVLGMWVLPWALAFVGGFMGSQ